MPKGYIDDCMDRAVDHRHGHHTRKVCRRESDGH